ncbi:O-antigen ligase family protein [Paenibacillus humicola]|uniref:O-antigen ligase family protein n=1 Tax=Paenibacillus humicola TaxID=3110540 RepID=UPI00237B816A|nr:O-antigen ligase family protein [Paenibacillus humicola]
MAAVLGMVAAATAAVLIVSVCRNGLFFDAMFYPWVWMLIAGFAAAWTCAVWHELRRRETRPASGASALRRVWNRGRTAAAAAAFALPAAAYGPLAMAAMYGLALLRHPASVHGTASQALRWTAYGAFLAAVAIWSGFKGGRIRLMAALQAAGAFTVWASLAGWLGWFAFPGFVLMTGDVRLSAVGARLGGFVQDPNFLGAAAGAFLLWQLALLARSGPRFAISAAAAAQTVPWALVLLLTESRGAWLAAAVCWTAGLALMKGNGRVRWLLGSGWTFACAGLAYRAVFGGGWRTVSVYGDGNGSAGADFAGTVLLVLITAASAGGLLLIRTVRLWSGGRCGALAAWGVLFAGAAALAALLPPAVHGRLAGHFQTAASRGRMYADALRLVGEAPLLGRGGDTWRMLFTQVQSQPYVGNEVHSGYMELLLDLGAAGLFVFLATTALLLRKVWRSDPAGLLPAGVLLLHAAIDFDMAFGSFWLLLYAWIGLYGEWRLGAERAVEAIDAVAAERASEAVDAAAAEALPRLGLAPSPPSSERSGGDPPPGGCAAAKAGAGSGRLQKLAAAARVTAALAACAIFAAGAVYGWRFELAARHREAAAASSGAAREAALRAALEANPYWTRIRLELAPLAPPPEQAALLAAGLRYEPQSVPLLLALGRLYAERRDVPQAEAGFRLALRYDRFNRAGQTAAVVAMTRLAGDLRAAGRLREAASAALAAVEFYAAYAAERSRTDAGSRGFAVTAAAKSAAAESRRLLEDLLMTAAP